MDIFEDADFVPPLVETQTPATEKKQKKKREKS